MENKKGIIKALMIQLCALVILALPILVPVAIAGSTVSLIFKFFEDAGKLGIDKSVNAMKELIEQFKNTEVYQKLLNEQIRPIVDQDNIRYSKIMMMLLFLQEDLESDKVKEYIVTLLQIAKSYPVTDRYIEAVKRHKIFSKKLEKMTSSHMFKTMQELAYLFDDDSPLSDEQLKNISGDLIYPLRQKAIVTSEFGSRKIEVKGKWYDFHHNGIDLAYGSEDSTCGVTIYAMHDGVIQSVDKENSGNAGNFVIIYNQDKNIRTAYFHLKLPPRWNIGDKIKKGEVVGLIGTTGLSTGCHLHLQMGTREKWNNPRQYLNFDDPPLP